MGDTEDLSTNRNRQTPAEINPDSKLEGRTLSIHDSTVINLSLPPNVEKLSAAWGGGAANVVTAGKALVLWPPLSVPQDTISHSREKKLLETANKAVDKLLEVCFTTKFDFTAGTGRNMLTLAMEEAREIMSSENRTARSVVREGFFKQALSTGVHEALVPLEHKSDSESSSYKGIEILNLRSLMFGAIDNLNKLDDLNIPADRLLEVAFPEIVALSKSDEEYTIVGSHIASFVPNFIGRERMQGIVTPSAMHLRAGHLDELIKIFEKPAAVNFLPVELQVQPEESISEHNRRESHAAKWVHDNFDGRHVVVDVGRAQGSFGTTRCDVYTGESGDTMRSQAQLLEAAHKPLELASGPYLLGGNPDHHVELSLEVNSLESLTSVVDNPEIPIGIVKTEFLISHAAGVEQQVSETSDELLKSVYLDFLMNAGDRQVCFRLVDEGDKVLIPPEEKIPFMKRQVDAMVFAAATEERELEIMIPDLHDVEYYHHVKQALADACANHNTNPEQFDLIPMVEGPWGRTAVRELLRAGESFNTISIGLSDLSTRESGISDRGDLSLRIIPDRVIRAVKDIVKMADAHGSTVRAAGKLARDTGNFVLLAGTGVTGVSSTADYFNNLAAVTSQLGREQCKASAKDCLKARNVYQRARFIDEHCATSGLSLNLQQELSDDADEQRDILES